MVQPVFQKHEKKNKKLEKSNACKKSKNIDAIVRKQFQKVTHVIKVIVLLMCCHSFKR